jgi:hypothetical protein
MKRFLVVFLILLPASLFSQEINTESDTLRKDALKVFMEATDYIKKEIPYVNYVRDIKEADVYIISTYQFSGSGGIVYTYYLVGQNKFLSMKDTLSVAMAPDDTDDMIRSKQVKTLKMGLMRYVAKTPLARYMNISFSQPMKETVSSDKWNSWVFNASLNAYMSGQSSYSNSYLFGNISANRVTEKMKFESSIGLDFQRDVTEYGDTTYESSILDKSAYLSYVKSVNQHWSSGGDFSIQTSTYANYDLSLKLAPGIEYDVFPYSESTRRMLTFRYKIGVELNNYTEETIRFKTKEGVGFHQLAGSLKLVQKWGSLRARLSWNNYFFDWSYYRINFNTDASIRIFKGLNFNVYGSVSKVNDQISLPSEGASLEDVLLRRKMQATQYQFYTSFGFSYTFGSIFNNVVNPRFD